MTDEVTCKEDLTLDELVHAIQNAWTRFRNAQLYAFCAAAPVLAWARENQPDFLTYCEGKGIKCITHETRVVELLLARDGESRVISRERRAEYADCLGWFADLELCPETDPDKAVALAKDNGRMTGTAIRYREKKDAGNPKAKAAKQKAQATKRARRQGGTENSVPRAASAAAARVFDEQIDSQPTIISRTLEPGQDYCESGGRWRRHARVHVPPQNLSRDKAGTRRR